jgi:hypothetical protein
MKGFLCALMAALTAICFMACSSGADSSSSKKSSGGKETTTSSRGAIELPEDKFD